MTALFLFPVGILVGILSAFFGFGGGSIMIPVLYRLFPWMTGQGVIACSQGVIVFTVIATLLSYRRLSIVSDRRLTMLLSISALLGSLLSTLVVIYIDTLSLKRLFAIALLFSVVLMFVGKKREELHWDVAFFSKTTWRPLIVGFSGGIMAGLTGLGGGVVMIPLLYHLLKMPLRWIPLYSNWAILLAASTGLAMHLFGHGPTLNDSVWFYRLFQIGEVNLAVIAFLLMGSALGSRLAAKWAMHVSEGPKKAIIAVLFTLLGASVLFP